jgi:hypothetical protein
MPQVIKHRRGSIGTLKDATTNNAELVVASGSIGDLNGPFTFIGSPTLADQGTTGAYRPISKIYTGVNPPSITVPSHGTVLDGTPYYSTNDQVLYILNSAGNQNIDLTGNIENNHIASVSIDELNGSVSIVGDITGSGNLRLFGNSIIDGNITLGGNITIGDQDIDFVTFNADVSSSIIPDVDVAFDLGTETKRWRNLYAEGIQLTTLSASGDLYVGGGDITTSQLTASLFNTTTTRINIGGDAEDINIGSSTSLTTFGGDIQVLGNDIQSSTGDSVITLNGLNALFNGNVAIEGNLTLLGDATEVNISSSTINLDDNIITLNAFAPFQRYTGFEVIDSGSGDVSASLKWDSLNDYWMVTDTTGESGKLLTVTTGSFGSEDSLTTNVIPKATSENAIGDSLLIDNGSELSYATDAITVQQSTGNTAVKGVVSLTNAGGADTLSDSSTIVFRNSFNQLEYIPSTDTSDVMDQIIGYRSSDGALIASSVIDGGSF